MTERGLEDRFAEALRRWRHGQIRPLWADASQGLKDQWLREVGVLLRLMTSLDLTVSIAAAPPAAELARLSARALAVTRLQDNPRAALVLFGRVPSDEDLRRLHDLLAGRGTS